jgi:hypothetical protein
LKTIGSVRSALGLTHTELWNAHGDFAGSSSSSGPRYDAFLRKRREFTLALQWAELVTGPAPRQKAPWGPRERIIAAVAALVTVLALAWLAADVMEFASGPAAPQPGRAVSQPARPAPPPVAAFKQPALTLPDGGTIRRHTRSAGLSPLEIITRSGAHYLVALYSVESNMRVVDVFIRGGTRLEVDVPTGTYVLKYAAGSTWYGYEHNFGPEASYNRADSLFTFARGSGYTVTLYRVIGGNLGISGVAADDF